MVRPKCVHISTRGLGGLAPRRRWDGLSEYALLYLYLSVAHGVPLVVLPELYWSHSGAQFYPDAVDTLSADKRRQ